MAEGRNIIYSLFDSHVAELIDQAIYHAEHVHLAAAEPAAGG
jgi:ArsR family transcriptional regulator, nickel/cobalt-responsive transcriptional repressor